MNAILKAESDKEIYPVQLQGEPLAETQIHIQQILDITQALQNHFEDAPVVVLADHTLYYDKNNPKKFIVPDVFVVKDVPKTPWRRVFKLWEEAVPSVMFEISSRETWGADLNKKWELYQRLKVQEYYIFDPEYDYLPEPLVAYHLNKRGELKQIKVKKNRVFSPALGLELVDTSEGLRFFNPQTNKFLPTPLELVEINSQLAKTNTELIETNTELVETNTELVETNTELVETNVELTETNIELNVKVQDLANDNESLKAELERLKKLLGEKTE
jgi:Uma2 family endonuclease